MERLRHFLSPYSYGENKLRLFSRLKSYTNIPFRHLWCVSLFGRPRNIFVVRKISDLPKLEKCEPNKRPKTTREKWTILHDINFFLTHLFERFTKTRKMLTSENPLIQKWMHFGITVPGHALAGTCVHALGHLRVRGSNQSNGKNMIFEKDLTPLSTR